MPRAFAYSHEQAEKLNRDLGNTAEDLQSLNFEGLRQSRSVSNDDVRKHLTHGVGRRLGVTYTWCL
jgi:hypothetical protein